MTPRFSLAALMTVVMAGAGFAALRFSTKLWASVVFSLTMTILLIGVLGRRLDGTAARMGRFCPIRMGLRSCCIWVVGRPQRLDGPAPDDDETDRAGGAACPRE